MSKKVLVFCLLIFSFVGVLNAQLVAKDDRSDDRIAIRKLVEIIFQAFVDKDSETLKATHSSDWAGYFLASRTLTQGIDGYMKQTSPSLNNENVGMVAFRFSEFEIDFQGDLALVFYVAEISGKNQFSSGHDKFRSLDVYAKRNGNWIQVASNLTRHPDAIADQMSSPSPVYPQLKQQILEARDEVWRAWLTNDEATLAKMLSDEVMALNGGEGKWLNKTEILAGAAQFEKSGAKLLRLEFPRTEIQLYGSSITLYTSYLIETELKGNRVIKKGLGAESFVLRNNQIVNTGWLLADAR